MAPKTNTLWSATVTKKDNPEKYSEMLEAERVRDEERRRQHPTRTPEELPMLVSRRTSSWRRSARSQPSGRREKELRQRSRLMRKRAWSSSWLRSSAPWQAIAACGWFCVASLTKTGSLNIGHGSMKEVLQIKLS
jgi:hypothetical protein